MTVPWHQRGKYSVSAVENDYVLFVLSIFTFCYLQLRWLLFYLLHRWTAHLQGTFLSVRNISYLLYTHRWLSSQESLRCLAKEHIKRCSLYQSHRWFLRTKGSHLSDHSTQTQVGTSTSTSTSHISWFVHCLNICPKKISRFSQTKLTQTYILYLMDLGLGTGKLWPGARARPVKLFNPKCWTLLHCKYCLFIFIYSQFTI